MKLIFSPCGRSGSSSLCYFIGNSCKINYCIEPYHPNTIKYNGNCDLKDLLNFGLIKILDWPLGLEKNKILFNEAEQIIFLYRVDILYQILSAYNSRFYKKKNLYGIYKI